jgi:predicted metal-binding membrane protein
MFAAGWALMTVAMMLPTSLPLIGLFHKLVSGRSSRWLLIGLCITGYLVIWVVFGFLAHFGVYQLQRWLDGTNFKAALLVVGGVYQFTPLKYHCLQKCRSPLSFITEHWHGRNESAESFWLGVHHGLFCIGCCWSLMLLMFLAVTVHIAWMLALGTIMAIEKNVAWGKWISQPLGVALILAGVVLRMGGGALAF